MRWSMVWLLAVVFVAALGCGDTNDGEGSRVSPEQVAALETALRAKPPLQTARQQYRAEVQQMADAIAALVPGLTWSMDTHSWTNCGGDYVWTDAKNAYFMVGFSGPIPDDKWSRAIKIVTDGAHRFGADDVAVVKDEPDDHDLHVSGADGVEFKLATQKASSLTARSDCRMSQTDTRARRANPPMPAD